ncbi:methyl-accepting chemotaxis protein [Sphingomonas sp. S2-65]|uniref:methyl-accepting chemotaxis protein n=1 Tax=Sphingomonas sp. S2-65 TaxID=2903960 RepID=UPI001F3B2D00|nr:methyl-accepting chemotaxis protein [Sphingomonas sp. S2-65]UYY59525.1 methyl-accepting chemotaxis protein [Sphingomonas sp. S2-65]
MSIANLVRAGSAALLALLLLAGVLAATRIDAIRMGGTVQLRSRQTADLIADILPPPEYVIEPYLEATLLLDQPQRLAETRARLKKLRADYDTRHAYWAASDADPELKQGIVEATHTPAAAFWAELEDRFLPAMARGDRDAASQSYAALTARYTEHRTEVDKLVTQATAYQGDLESGAASLLKTTIILLSVLGVALLALVAGSAFILLRRVARPLLDVSDATARLAAGAEAVVPHRDRQDELGRIANAVEQFRLASTLRAESDAETARQQAHVTGALSQSLTALRGGNLTQTIDSGFPADYEALRTDFNEAVDALREMMSAVRQSAGGIDTGSREIAAASEDLARRTEASASSLAETRSAIEQIEARLKAGIETARGTASRADVAYSAVAKGRNAADQAVSAMDRVSASADDIGSVIEGLDKIAFQTRVLSMNATVEAGRAGEAGRGFAVVADLVSALAQRAEGEAKRVRDLITITSDEIRGAVVSVRQTDAALGTISEEVSGVRDLLGVMSVDNAAQSAAVTQIATSVVAMDETTQQNAAMVEQTSAAARNLSAEVAALADRAAAFKVDFTAAEPSARRAPFASIRLSG